MVQGTGIGAKPGAGIFMPRLAPIADAVFAVLP
jgi:hypothetical protein